MIGSGPSARFLNGQNLGAWREKPISFRPMLLRRLTLRGKERGVALLAIYVCTLTAAIWLAYQLRFDFSVPRETKADIVERSLLVVGLQLVFLILFRQFSGILRYFSLPDIFQIGWAIGLSSCALLAAWVLTGGQLVPPRGVLLIDGILAFGGICGLRMGWVLASRRIDRGAPSTEGARAVVLGAGDVGANLVRELDARPGLGLRPILFLDDEKRKRGSYVHGIRVEEGITNFPEVCRRYEIETVIIAMPSASARKIKEIAATARQHQLKCITVPAIDQLTSGRVSVTQLHPVSILDLLGREPVGLEADVIRGLFEGKVVMVTGAGGSIGSEICRQVASYGPARVLMVDQSEVQLFPIEQELIEAGFGAIIVPVVAGIQDAARMDSILREFRPKVILHAAAHKHVPLMERQPAEAIRNNALSSACLANLAVVHGVERFLMISTDKAVNPTNVMGASKRLAEMYLQALSNEVAHRTRFAAVRFGNVLGSSGSVVPTFTRQIARGGPVTVTHPKMVRYFMTIPEAVGLVLQSCAQASGGEIFVLDMGQPIRIAELARQMIELSGLKPDIDIDILYTGLRPGEKLFEELNCHEEAFQKTLHPKIMSFISQPRSLAAMKHAFARLERALYTATCGELMAMIAELVPEYEPSKGQPGECLLRRGVFEQRGTEAAPAAVGGQSEA